LSAPSPYCCPDSGQNQTNQQIQGPQFFSGQLCLDVDDPHIFSRCFFPVSGPPLESPLPSATHLICAFDNTPKAKEVRRGGGGRGAIVGTEWLKECARGLS